MGIEILFSIAAGFLASTVGVLWLRHRFTAKLNAFESKLMRASSPADVCHDLPPEIAVLAKRLGARPKSPASYVKLQQSGDMWMSPAAKSLKFAAQQLISTTSSGFMWRALMDPLGLIMVADYLVGGHGGLDVRFMGAVPIAYEAGTADADLGEMLRYLAELPWNPDAILQNDTLEWSVVDLLTFKVATDIGVARAEITFTLGPDGLIDTARAASRPYNDGKMRHDLPWHGLFWDYHQVEGRMIPMQAEVAWVLDSHDYTYWRGKITAWAAG